MILTRQINNQGGSMIAVVIMLLALLTIIGIAGITTSNTEQQTAAGEQFYKMAFFSAEAGGSYVMKNTDLYHGANVTPGGSLNFPDPADGSVQYNLSNQQSFDGSVEYMGSSSIPRGLGFEAATYRSHVYRIISNGHGPRNSQIQIEEGFYRIGF